MTNRTNKQRFIDANAAKMNAFIVPDFDEAVIFVRDIDKMPTIDVVSEQIRWERDVAIQQLEEHGIPFGGIAPDVVKVVRCKNCKYGIWSEEEQMWQCVISAEQDDETGMFFGFSEYNDADHFCSYGENRIEENRIFNTN